MVEVVAPPSHSIRPEGEEFQPHSAQRLDEVIGEVVIDRRRRWDGESMRERIHKGGSLLRAGTREGSRWRKHEHDAAYPFVVPPTCETREGAGEDPPPLLARRVHSIQSQGLDRLLRTRDAGDEGTDQVRAIQSDCRGQVHHGELPEPLVHVTAKYISNGPPRPFGGRPQRALLRTAGSTRAVAAPQRDDL